MNNQRNQEPVPELPAEYVAGPWDYRGPGVHNDNNINNNAPPPPYPPPQPQHPNNDDIAGKRVRKSRVRKS